MTEQQLPEQSNSPAQQRILDVLKRDGGELTAVQISNRLGSGECVDCGEVITGTAHPYEPIGWLCSDCFNRLSEDEQGWRS